MSLTNDQLLDRIVALEAALATLETAVNNVATKKELKNLFAILQGTVDSLTSSVTQVKNTGSNSAPLADHKVDPAAHTQLDTRYFAKSSFLDTSAGTADAGKPIKLSTSGVLDSSILPGGSVTDHGQLGGLTDDDHPIYILKDGTRALTAAWAANGRIYDSGAALNIGGSATTTHSLTTGDIIVGGKLEVDGVTYFDKQVSTYLNTTNTPTGTTSTIDFNNGNSQILNLASASGDVTVTLSNAVAGSSYIIKIIQHASSAKNVIFTGVKWTTGTAPTITTSASAVDIASIWSDGSTLYGSIVQDLR